MLYLLDANVLIDADRDYYPQTRVPEFWSWLLHWAQVDNIKIPFEIYGEIVDGTGRLTDWIRQPSVKNILLLDEEPKKALINRVISEGYAPDLTDTEYGKLGCDPFLMAYALRDPKRRRVVTTEGTRPKKQRANRLIPDVCQTLGLRCLHTFKLIQELNFSTSWQTT